tara:strand:+ start:128 stop:1741 length:1614 start_codon:yes stop_codon:yes gene_type:complete
MANTGFKITPTLVQNFVTGPESGSLVSGTFGNFTTQLGVSPFSASLDDNNYFYRIIDETVCPEGFEDCLAPLLTNVVTGSSKGLFNINYTSPLSNNTALKITGSISQFEDMSSPEIFSASISGLLPISSSFISGTVYFRAFQSCSGLEHSQNSNLIQFTYAPIPPPVPPGTVTLQIQNTLNSPITADITSTNGRNNQTIAAGVIYSVNLSLTSTIRFRGGGSGTYGNNIIKRISGDGSSFNTSGFSGNSVSFNNGDFTTQIYKITPIKPGTSTTIRFTYSVNTPPPPPRTAATPPSAPYVPSPTIRFGSSPYSTADAACSAASSRSQTYYQLGNTLYATQNDAISRNSTTYPNSRNYILISSTKHMIVNERGYIISSSKNCSFPGITFSRKSYSNQESACKDSYSLTQSYPIKDGRLVGSSLSGRFKMNTGKGGRNIILSGGKVIAYETCGSEGSGVTYSRIGYTASRLENPYRKKLICNGLTPRLYFLGPSGILYYSSSGSSAYIPVGLGSRYYFIGSTGYLFNRGNLVGTINLNC